MASTAKKIKPEMASDPEQSINRLDCTDRDSRIAELAYYKAEQRGFEPGSELDDWIDAERELLE